VQGALRVLIGNEGVDEIIKRLSSSVAEVEIVVFGWGSVVGISGRTITQTQAGGDA
jgi:hypothetical protein